ncbi:hypothetical protein ACG7TL_004449 [Trametes sanguinea]
MVFLHIVQETTKIVFNTLDLKLGDITLQVEGHEDVLHASEREFDSITARGIITFPKTLPAATANARLTVAFEGRLARGLSGYYRSPTAARKAFPCWDEPALKATFAITMLSKFGSVNLSNMPVQSEEWKVTKFQTTPPVSTYLVAYANGPFEFLESAYKSPLSGKVRPLRIYATADNIWQGQFALDVVQKVMPLYEAVFDVEYPLPKLDILAGLIMGRTSCFLDDPNANNLRNKQYVASMASHEVAHMWFGDITTMEWWDNLYLNEGACYSWRELHSGLFPEWRLDAQFLGSNFYPARTLDAKLSSHPIEVECPDANKIIQIFDNLSYSKAASVLRMLASYVGEDMFLKGVSAYLKKHKYKNTVTSDLWEGIQSVTSTSLSPLVMFNKVIYGDYTDQDIPGMMDNWVKKARNHITEKEGGIQIQQERFLETGPADPAHNETIWTVPLSLLTMNEDGSFKIHSGLLLTEREKFIPLDMSRPFKLNAGTTGFCLFKTARLLDVVQYSPDRLIKLGKQAVSQGSPFALQDRIGLVRDAFTLASSGHSSVSSALGLVDSMRATNEYLVWDAVASLFVPIARKLGFEQSASDTPDDQQLRVKAIEQAAEAGDLWVVKEMIARFEHFMDTGDDARIPSELAGMIYRVRIQLTNVRGGQQAVQEGNKREWEFLKNLASNASSPSQSLAAMSAMGATRNMQLAEATFKYATTEARDQNVVYFFRAMQRNRRTRRWFASRVLENFDEAAFGGLASDEDYEKVAAFFKDKNTAAYNMQLHQTLDTIKFNAQWIKRSTEELKQWLKEHPMPLQDSSLATAPGNRLPTDVVPNHYDLTVHTDLENAMFDGIMRIRLHVKRRTSTIVLNSVDLQLSDISLQVSGRKDTLKASESVVDSLVGRGIIVFPEALPAGSEARLAITFGGKLTSSLRGYYTSFGGKDGKEVYSLTQFQPTSARRAFPCWDEPALKATFSMTMLSKVGSVNLSNMAAISEKACDTDDAFEDDPWLAMKAGTLDDLSQWKITRFETTPPISTYLVAYANGPFKYLERSYTSPLSGKVRPLRIYATEDIIWQGQYALDIAQKVMPLYEQVFDVEYPLPKLDFLAGLIMGKTTCFLDNPEAKDVGEIMILVRAFPEWRLDAQFLGWNYYPARALDAKLSSHPVEVECPDENKIIQMFDDLSYNKAAAVLRMLSTYVGEKIFLKGVSVYLKKHKFKNTVTSDLWEGIQSVTISVVEKEGGIQVRQDRYLETGPAEPEDNETIWTIPLNLLTVRARGTSQIDHTVLLDSRERFIRLDTSKPFKVNAGTKGFYVVQYSPDRLVQLGRQAVARDSPFTLQDRVGLVRDAFALGGSGHSSVSSALGLVDALRTTEEYLVWNAIAAGLSNIAWTWWEHPEVVNPLNAFRRSLFVPIAKKLGFAHLPCDTPDDQLMRIKAIEEAAEARDPWAVGEMKARFAHFLKTGDESRIASDLANVTYRIAVQEGGRREWEFLERLASSTANPSQALAAYAALGATRDMGLAEATFRYATTEARDQDVLTFLKALQRNVATRRWLAEKVMHSFGQLEKKYAGTFTFNKLLDAAFGGLASMEDHKRVADFFKGKDTKAYDLQLQQTLDTIKFSAGWIERSTEEIKRWLEEHLPRPTKEQHRWRAPCGDSLYPKHLLFTIAIPIPFVVGKNPADVPLDQRPPTLIRKLHMLALARLEHDAPALVELAQPDPILLIQRLQTHRHDRLLLRPHPVFLRRGRVGAEPRRLLRHDRLVRREQHEHQALQARQVLLERRVPRRAVRFVVQGREEAVARAVDVEAVRVAEVLRLDEVALGPVGVDASARCPPGELAEEVPWATAGGEVGDTHVLRAKGDEVVHGRGVVGLDVGSQKLAAWETPSDG